MSTLGEKVIPALTFRNFQEAVRWAIGHGLRFWLRPDGVIEYWNALPGGRRYPVEYAAAFIPFHGELKRRLKKPPGWPKDVGLPPWWSDIAFGFKIKRGRPNPCTECGFPVVVLIDLDDWTEWRCPQCGSMIEPCSANVKPVS